MCKHIWIAHILLRIQHKNAGIYVYFLAHPSQILNWNFLIKLCHLSSSSCHKLCIFSSSFPIPFDQFQPHLAQSIIAWREIKFVHIQDHALLKGKTILKKMKICRYCSKLFFSKIIWPEKLKLFWKHLW